VSIPYQSITSLKNNYLKDFRWIYRKTWKAGKEKGRKAGMEGRIEGGKYISKKANTGR